MNDWLKFEKNGSVVTLTMNRPDIRNPLGEPEDVTNFEEASKLINDDRDVRCVILTGAGKAFLRVAMLKICKTSLEIFQDPL
jgi:enoyl-CoA hydratase/carnithine racemase